MYGYMGKIIRINLRDRSIKVEDLDLDTAQKYLGSRGLGGVKIMMDEVPANVDPPLSEENKMIIATGALTGGTSPYQW